MKDVLNVALGRQWTRYCLAKPSSAVKLAVACILVPAGNC